MSFASLIALSAAFHFYVGARLAPSLPGPWPMVLVVLLAASALLMPMGLLSRRRAGRAGADVLAWAGLLLMGLFSSLFVGTVLRDAVLLVAWLVDLAAPSALPLESLRYWSAIAVPLAGLAITFLGFLNARRTARVVTVPIPVAGLPAELHGFTIVQISDIHVGPTIRGRQVEAIVERVNRLQPDLVAITGDLVDGSVADLAEQVAPLARLRSRHGSFFVTGNHEYYSGAVSWIAHLGTLDIRVLHNEHVVIEHGGARLLMAGVTDYSAGHFHETHRSDPHAAMAGAPADAAFKVLLAHQPRSAAAAAQAGFDLQLSGHTHGGQFLPWNFFVKLQQPFTAGLHVLDELRIYVSRGTGYWGPPKRFFAPSEITAVKLVPKA
ncbi:MAG TPA: metallophosphoesterase [Ramlibacter sp.]|nr:metallophosphoesterase [Ramlibacter sp.]